MVIGRVSTKSFEQLSVDIGAPTTAVLATIDFEGATKRNKPQVDVGDLVYARVKEPVNKFYKPVLTCIHPTVKKDFASGEAYFGILKNGFLLELPQVVTAYLLRDDCPLLHALGERFEFDINVGHNGRTWVNSPKTENLV